MLHDAIGMLNPHTSHLLIFGWVGHVLGDVLHRVAHGLWWVLLMLTTEARRIGRGMVAVAEGLLPATWTEAICIHLSVKWSRVAT